MFKYRYYTKRFRSNNTIFMILWFKKKKNLKKNMYFILLNTSDIPINL